MVAMIEAKVVIMLNYWHLKGCPRSQGLIEKVVSFSLEQTKDQRKEMQSRKHHPLN